MVGRLARLLATGCVATTRGAVQHCTTHLPGIRLVSSFSALPVVDVSALVSPLSAPVSHPGTLNYV